MPHFKYRLAASAFAALVAALISFVVISRGAGYATDFAWFWLAGRAVIEGVDPYALINAGVVRGFTFDQGFMYPLNTALVATPFALFTPFAASILFAAASAFVLCFALTRESWDRWPILLSFPMLWSISAGQWSPFVTAAALGSGYAWLASVKPTMGAAMFLRRPSWRFVAIGLIPVLIAFAISPRWPLDWWQETRAGSGYHVPLLQPGGVLLLGALWKWRDHDARLLAGMSIVPQTPLLYDQLPLLLLSRTRYHSYLFAIYSYLAPWAAVWWAKQNGMDLTGKSESLAFMATVITWTYYLPLLFFVCWRKRDPIAATTPSLA